MSHPMATGPIDLRVVDPQGHDAMALLADAAAQARAMYPELFADDAPPAANAPASPASVYLIAYRGHEPLGCGALRPLADDAGHAMVDGTRTAEVRRMFVRTEVRRQGIAAALLDRLMHEAVQLGYTRLRLETGHRQSAAMALYTARGFTRIEPFGVYVGDPTSVCFERRLAPQPEPPRA